MGPAVYEPKSSHDGRVFKLKKEDRTWADKASAISDFQISLQNWDNIDDWMSYPRMVLEVHNAALEIAQQLRGAKLTNIITPHTMEALEPANANVEAQPMRLSQ